MIAKAQVIVKIDNEETSITVEPKLETILQAALDQNLDLPYSCMGGACSSCRARLIEGKVEMDLNLILTDEEIESGYILACQARPVTEKIVIDFEQ